MLIQSLTETWDIDEGRDYQLTIKASVAKLKSTKILENLKNS